jgi:hypothetical protein
MDDTAAYNRRMDSLELLSYMTRKQVDSLFEAVKLIPDDKIDWKPSPDSRSTLDQLQELATVFRSVPDAVKARKLDFTPEKFEEYQKERKKVTDPAELERMIREGTEDLLQFVRTVRPEELDDPVEMPWPGEYKVADMLYYHFWNMGYHEGQIYYISTMLPKS